MYALHCADTSTVGAGGGPIFFSPSHNTGFTTAVAPVPVNPTARNEPVLASEGSNLVPSNSSSGSGKSEGENGTMNVREGIVGAAVFGAILVGVAALLV